MKTLPRLYQALTDLGFADFGTVAHIGRTLREAGLIHTGKRGRGALPASAADCAALLLAVVVPSRTPAERLAIVRELLPEAGLLDRFHTPRDYTTHIVLAPGVRYDIFIPAEVFAALAC